METVQRGSQWHFRRGDHVHSGMSSLLAFYYVLSCVPVIMMTTDQIPRVPTCFGHHSEQLHPDKSTGLQDMGGSMQPLCFTVQSPPPNPDPLPTGAEPSSSKKPQHWQDYSSLGWVPNPGLGRLGTKPWTFLPPLSGPSQPSAAPSPPSRSIFSAFLKAASEREARRQLLFIYMGITGDQKSALK